MLKKAPFFDFLNRRQDANFETFLADHNEDEHYINWNEFLMPNNYGDAEFEYRSVRNECAICDISPMRKILISGLDAGRLIDHLVTRPVSGLGTMRATYTVMCNDDGTLKDDAIIYKLTHDEYLMLPSDIDHIPYFQTVCERFDIHGVSFEECTDTWLGLAIQGPLSAAAMHAMGFDGAELLKPFDIRDYECKNGTLRVARMGFTADLGYEIWLHPGSADELMQRIRTARIDTQREMPGYGLTALQVCRIEGGFIVAGWDCSTEIDPQPGFERTPYELGLDWLVNLEGCDFVGRQALRNQAQHGRRFRFRNLTIDPHYLPEDGASIFANVDGEKHQIGIVTCSAWSWGIGKTLGNASIGAEFAHVNNAWLEVQENRIPLSLDHGAAVKLNRRNAVPAALD